MISYITSYIIDLIKLGWISIIHYPKIHFSFMIYYLILLIFLINFFNQFIFNYQYNELIINCFFSQIYVKKYISIN